MLSGWFSAPSRAEERGSVRTFSPKPADIQRAWHVVDADGMVLGRLATEVARVLRGKHKPTYAPHVDTGDYVIVVNASKIVMTAGKADKTVLYWHTGYPRGRRPPGAACAPRPRRAKASSSSTSARSTPTSRPRRTG